MNEFYYDYLKLRKGDKINDLRIIGVGTMDKAYVGADPSQNELEIVQTIEKKILKLRLTSMTICKFEP